MRSWEFGEIKASGESGRWRKRAVGVRSWRGSQEARRRPSGRGGSLRVARRDRLGSAQFSSASVNHGGGKFDDRLLALGLIGDRGVGLALAALALLAMAAADRVEPE